jgi:adenylate cyclase
MGDAVLAFFPGHSAASSCEAALQSASAIIKDLASSQLHGLLVGVGIALHYGEVSYGNIGSGRRMDFTMIGPDVNMVSRIQSVSSELKLPLLMSERFENAVATDTKSVGHYSLKGFPGMAELFTSHSA